MNTAAQAALEELRRLSPDIQAAVVLGPAGEILALSAQKAVADAMGPILTTLTGIAGRSAQELGRGAFQTIIVEGSQGLIVGQDAGAGQLVAAVANRSSRIGLLLDDVRACASQVAQLPA